MAYPSSGADPAYPVSRAQRLVNLAGAVGSVALVVSLAWWGYELAVRDVTGVPVVRALEGPARIAPQDPEGAVMAHQGLSVNDVAAEGTAAPPPDRLVLAPKPIDLTLEDTAGLAGAVAPADPLPARLESPASLIPLDPVASDPAIEAALAEAMADTPIDAMVEVAALDDSGMPPPEGAITRSLRPLSRPDRASTPEAAYTPEIPVEIDPSIIPPGTRLVQFDAFDTADEARAEWTRLSGRFGALLAGKAMVLEAATSGGRTFWRLRAHGFADEDEARRFCAALVTEGANCIPVAQR